MIDNYFKLCTFVIIMIVLVDNIIGIHRNIKKYSMHIRNFIMIEVKNIVIFKYVYFFMSENIFQGRTFVPMKTNIM